MDQDPTINALREALSVTPANLPLRKHLADSLAKLGRYEEAETEFRLILAETPENIAARLGLAQCYAQQNKNSHALVVVEDLIKSPECPAE
ncbi:MAG: tetratricopeptide repeat protein, partial [Planctomycetaceae bacterium]|nr:tetratricopeptide repeat protein [Planctomycetaceae bacterium]